MSHIVTEIYVSCFFLLRGFSLIVCVCICLFKFSRTDKMYASFSRIGAQIGNSIPYSIKIHKRSSFRKKIKELSLNFLRSEDDYVEVSRLIKLFNTLG